MYSPGDLLGDSPQIVAVRDEIRDLCTWGAGRWRVPTTPGGVGRSEKWPFMFPSLQLGETADKISFEKFAAKLRKNRADLLAKHNCKGVRFSVYEKDGKAAIKASAIR